MLHSIGDTIKLKIRSLPLGSLQSNRGYNTYTQKIVTGGKCEQGCEWYGNISTILNFKKSLVIKRKLHELTWHFGWAMKNRIWQSDSKKQSEQKV